jgi:hypothetical protein
MRAIPARKINNGRFIGLLAPALVFAGFAATARGQYAGTVLYSINPPAGVTGQVYVNGGDDTGQIVGNVGMTSLLWSTTAAPIVLNPTGSDFIPIGISGSQLVGTYQGQADLRNSPLGSDVNLNPSGFVVGNGNTSTAFSTNGSQQVGYTTTIPRLGGSETNNAYLWNGSQATATNLNPTGFTNTLAFGTNGTQQVGEGSGTATATTLTLPPPVGTFTEDETHALLWNGSASNYVDLNPAGFLVGSAATAISGNQEVGYGAPPGTNLEDTLGGSNYHALVWNGTAASYVDLNPDGFIGSEALGTNGYQQVGLAYATTISYYTPEAFLWDGSADSAVNLQSVLPTNDTWARSYPLGIDQSGNVFGYAVDSSNNYFAIEWSQVPEPTSLGLMAMLCAGGLLRRKNRIPEKPR